MTFYDVWAAGKAPPSFVVYSLSELSTDDEVNIDVCAGKLLLRIYLQIRNFCPKKRYPQIAINSCVAGTDTVRGPSGANHIFP